MFEVGALCEICGIQGHIAAKCQSTFSSVKHAKHCKTMANAHKIIPSETQITPVGEIT